MNEIQLPKMFIRDKNKERPPISFLIEEYEKRNGSFGTMGYDWKEGELETVLERCLKENKQIKDIIGIDLDVVAKDEYI